MIRFLLVLPFVLALGCAHKIHKAPPPDATRELLFPHGTYQHDVKVHLAKPPPKGPQDFEFRGVCEFRQDHLSLVALSPFGTTLFRVNEDLKTHVIQMEIFVESLKKYEDRIKPLYIVTRDVLTLPLMDFGDRGIQVLSRNEKNRPLKIIVPTENSTVAVDISKYDDAEIPKNVTVHADQFQLNVDVVDYEL